MNKKHLFRFLTSTLHPSFGGVGRGLTLIVCLLCALGAEAKDAYAVLSSDNTTLTFYYDNSINSRQGTKYFLNSVKDYPDWNKNVSQYSAPLPITTVIFDASFKDARPTTTNYWFYKFGNLTTITGISNLNTSKVTSMCSMFSYCSKLPTIDLNGFNTSLVTDMSYMFNQCSSLIQLDFTSFNTANVISMGYMFNGCSSLNSLAMTSFNTSKVTDMPGMFQSCRNLRLLDLRSFNTSNVSRTGWMFNECSSLQAIIVGDGWNTDAVEESSRMFVGCDNLVGEAGTTFSGNHIDVSYAHVDGGPTNPGYLSTWDGYGNSPYVELSNNRKTMTFYKDGLRHMRTRTYNLKSDDYPPAWYYDGTYSGITIVVFHSSFANARPISTAQWFSGMNNLTTINGINFLNTEKVEYMFRMFAGCKQLTAIDLSGFNTSNVTGMGNMFLDCLGLTTLDLSNFKTSKVKEMYGMFSGCKNLTSIYVGNGWSTAAVTKSELMFSYCQSLVGQQGTTYDPSHEDASYAHIDGGPSNPGYFSRRPYAVLSTDGKTLTFYNDGQMQSHSGKTFYDLNQGDAYPRWYTDQSYKNITQVVFDASFSDTHPTSTYSWFREMTNLTTIRGLGNLKTSLVTNMAYMFYNCQGLTSIDLSHFNTDNVTDMRDIFGNCRGLTSIDLSSFNTENVTDMSAMFYYCNGLKTIDLSRFNTAKVTKMGLMFSDCSSLKGLDLSSFNTAKVTDMNYMFSSCSSLTTILVDNGWTTAAVSTGMDMFLGCTKLVGGQGTTYSSQHNGKEYARIDGGTSAPGYLTDKSTPYVALSADGKTLTFYADGKRLLRTERTYALNQPRKLPDWKTDPNGAHYVTTVVFDASFVSARPVSTCSWFATFAMLTTITHLEYLNTSEVTDMSQMFSSCLQLTNLDLRTFNTANVTNMYGMFHGSNALTSINLASFSTAGVTDMRNMFSNCTSLTTVCVGDGWDAGRAQTDDMFYRCYNIVGEVGTTYNSAYDEHVGEDAAHIDTEDYPGYFVSVNYLTVPYALLSADGKTLTFYHDGQRATRRTYKTYSTYMATNEEPGWYNDDSYSEITRAVFDPSFANARPTSTYYWFGQMHQLANIDGMEFLNTSEVTSMEAMFEECVELTSLDVSHFDTRNVTIMSGMFNDCCELTTLDVSGFNTSNVTSMYNMFNYCSNLTELDLSNFDTKKVTSMNDMFCACESLTSLDLTSFNTANVTRMSSMFEGCKSLTDIDLRSFNTIRVTDMGNMFATCKALKSLDLSSFNTANVTKMMAMFRGCTDLQTISVSDLWNTDNVTNSNNMFKDCTKLVGGQGTTFDANHIDKAYARIDGGKSAPGYFTYAPHNDNFAPYAVHYWNDDLLVFFNDGDWESHMNIGQTIYLLNEAGEEPDWLDDGISSFITDVVFDSSFASARPTTTQQWFDSMEDLERIEGLKYLNTSEVTDMTGMFSGCSDITTLDLRTFNTAKVTSMAFMFSDCSSLSVIYLDDLNTANVTDMEGMFKGCINLTDLDLSSFNTTNVTDMSGMFYSCGDLSEVIVGNGWTTANVTHSDEMFSDCINLEGGQGTTYDPNHIDAEYAHIDGGPSNPGYFTASQTSLLGDVNGDGLVGIGDIVAITNVMAGIETNPAIIQRADVNADGDIGIGDIVAITNIMAGK